MSAQSVARPPRPHFVVTRTHEREATRSDRIDEGTPGSDSLGVSHMLLADRLGGLFGYVCGLGDGCTTCRAADSYQTCVDPNRDCHASGGGNTQGDRYSRDDVRLLARQEIH